jgi:hypothetical protein
MTSYIQYNIRYYKSTMDVIGITIESVGKHESNMSSINIVIKIKGKELQHTVYHIDDMPTKCVHGDSMTLNKAMCKFYFTISSLFWLFRLINPKENFKDVHTFDEINQLFKKSTALAKQSPIGKRGGFHHMYDNEIFGDNEYDPISFDDYGRILYKCGSHKFEDNHLTKEVVLHLMYQFLYNENITGTNYTTDGILLVKPMTILECIQQYGSTIPNTYDRIVKQMTRKLTEHEKKCVEHTEKVIFEKLTDEIIASYPQFWLRNIYVHYWDPNSYPTMILEGYGRHIRNKKILKTKYKQRKQNKVTPDYWIHPHWDCKICRMDQLGPYDEKRDKDSRAKKKNDFRKDIKDGM